MNKPQDPEAAETAQIKDNPERFTASDLFGLEDELAFRRQFVTQFLASWCATHFHDFCARGLQEQLERPPVEDADYLSFAAWKHWRETMNPNADVLAFAGEKTPTPQEAAGSGLSSHELFAALDAHIEVW